MVGQMSQDEINVGLFDEVKRLKEEISQLKWTLESCKYHAENIIGREYGETMDAHYIVEKVDEILNED